MYLSLKVDRAIFLNALYFFTYFILLVWVNNSYAYVLHEYMGSAEKNVDLPVLFYLFVLAVICSFLCGSRVSKPGDLVVTLLVMVVVPHALVLNGANSFYPEASPFFGICLSVLFGVLLVSLINKVNFRDVGNSADSGAGYLAFVAFLNILVLIFIVIKSADYFSFEFSAQYLRRAIARDVFATGSLGGYIASIGTQAFFPVLFAWGVYKKSSFFFWLGIINVLILWGAFGQKYPFVVLLLIYFMMEYFRRFGKINVSWLLFLAIGLLCSGIIEHELLGYSYINDYFVRRAYVVPSTLLGAAELFSEQMGINNYSDTAIGFVFGQGRSEPITFQVGETIYNNPELNANVNFFAVAYLRYGYIGVFVESLVVGSIIMLLNFLYSRSAVFAAMPVALLFATKIVEQSLPTILLGSGMFFMLLLLLLMSLSRSRSEQVRSVI